jgi:protease-4
MRSVAASGGYYLAAGTDYIVANRLTLTGSIGVIIGGYNYAELFDMIGLKSENYQSGEMKDMLNMARQRTAEEKKLIQELVDEIHHEFATIVADGRPDLEIDDVKSGPIGEAQIFSGKKAKELGLVDELGYFEDAVVKARELAKAANATIVRYTYRPTLGNLLFSLKSPGTGLLGRLLPEEQQIVKKGRLYFLLPRAY